MRQLSQFLALSTLMLGLLPLASCGTGKPVNTVIPYGRPNLFPQLPPGVIVKNVVISPAGGQVEAGQTLQLFATVIRDDGEAIPNVALKWESNKGEIATVDDKGVVKAVSAGEVEIAATIQEKTFKVKVTVTPAPIKPPPPPIQTKSNAALIARIASILVTPSSSTVYALNGTQQFVAVAKDADGAEVKDISFKWSTTGGDNDPVATINSTGVLTAKSTGTTRVTAVAVAVDDDGKESPADKASEPILITVPAGSITVDAGFAI